MGKESLRRSELEKQKKFLRRRVILTYLLPAVASFVMITTCLVFGFLVFKYGISSDLGMLFIVASVICTMLFVLLTEYRPVKRTKTMKKTTVEKKKPLS